MSRNHPIVAVTGSSGSGTTNVRVAFEHIFRREGLSAAFVEGDCFHRHNRERMEEEVRKAARQGRIITHFGPGANLFEELESCFASYAEHGGGKRRHYIHNEKEMVRYGAPPGSLTAWEKLPENTDLLFYEGLHGGLVLDNLNIAKHVDLLIGVAPIINLEWIQKIQRDKAVRGYSEDAAIRMILNRIEDYVRYIVPQFSRTDINFQRIPTIDTSNPFTTQDIPTNDESFSIVHVRNPKKIQVDYRYLLDMLDGSFMSRPDTIVVPAGKKIFCMELIITPSLQHMMEQRDNA